MRKMNKNDNQEQGFMTAQQVAEEFFEGKFNYHGILRLTRTGKLPAVKVGKKYLYRRSDLEEWIELNFTTPADTDIKFTSKGKN